jgi:hypothetical protein
MGDETKKTELDHGNYDPLHATRKPSTAESVDDDPADVAQMPTKEELARRDTQKRD